MKKNIIAAIAAIAMMAAFSGTANAVWTVGTANKKVSVQLTAKTSQTVTTALNKYTDTGNLTAGSAVIFRLTGGATFVADPTSLTQTGNATVGIVGTAAGATFAKYAITATGTSLVYSLTLAGINLSAVPVGTSVDITFETVDNLGNSITPPQSLAGTATMSNLFTMVDAVTATVTSQSDTANVAKGFKNHTAASGVENGTATALTLVTPATTALGKANDNVLITLTGDFTGIGSVSGTGITSTTATGSTTGTTAGFFTIDRVAGKAYATSTNNLVAQAVAPVFVWDGATAQPARSFTVTVDGLAPAAGTATLTYPYSVLAATTIYSTTRNGANFTSDNISPTSVIRISDNNATSTTAGVITYSVWDAAGAQVTQVGATLPTSVLGGHTVTIAKGVLKAAFPTGVRFNINIESSNASVTHFKSNAAGLNVIVGNSAGTSQL